MTVGINNDELQNEQQGEVRLFHPSLFPLLTGN